MEKMWTPDSYIEDLDKFLGVTKYAVGCVGYALTASRIQSQARRAGEVGAWYARMRVWPPIETNKDYLLSYANKGLYCADCIGFVKAPLMGNIPGETPCNTYDRHFDYSIEKLAGMCTDVTSDISKGGKAWFMWTENFGHCAVIKNPGQTDLESAPTTDGVAEVSIHYQPNWFACGKLPFIDYGDQPTPAPIEEDEVKFNQLPYVRRGDKGDAVRTVQANVGVVVDGDFGINTYNAVKNFQKTHKLSDGRKLEVDGIVGPMTWQAILESLYV